MSDNSLDHFKTDANGERYAGDHLLIEFWGAKHLGEPESICQALEDGARSAGATILHSHYHLFGDGGMTSSVHTGDDLSMSLHAWRGSLVALRDEGAQ